MATEDLCLEALERLEGKLSRRPDVVGLGIVSADESDPGGKDLAVAVYVDTARADSEVDRRSASEGREESERIPDALELEDADKVLHRVTIRVIEQGQVELEMEPPELE